MPPGIRPKTSFGAGIPLARGAGREVEGDRHAGEMADIGDALRDRACALGIVRQGLERALDRGSRRAPWRRPGASGSPPGSAGRGRDCPCGPDARSSRRRAPGSTAPQEWRKTTTGRGAAAGPAAWNTKVAGARRADRPLGDLGDLVVRPARPASPAASAAWPPAPRAAARHEPRQKSDSSERRMAGSRVESGQAQTGAPYHAKVMKIFKAFSIGALPQGRESPRAGCGRPARSVRDGGRCRACCAP